MTPTCYRNYFFLYKISNALMIPRLMQLTSYLNVEKVLWILEDDPGSRIVFEEILETRYQLFFFETLESFKQALETECSPPHLCIVDLRLSDGNFLTFLQNKDTQFKFQLP